MRPASRHGLGSCSAGLPLCGILEVSQWISPTMEVPLRFILISRHLGASLTRAWRSNDQVGTNSVSSVNSATLRFDGTMFSCLHFF